MITLYRDPRGEHVFSADGTNCQAPKLSTVFVKNIECTGCLNLLEEVKSLKQALDKVLVDHTGIYATCVYSRMLFSKLSVAK